MAKKKRKGTQLPRVSILAYNRRDLLAFVEAVEQLRHAVADLGVLLEQLKQTPRRAAKKNEQTPQ